MPEAYKIISLPAFENNYLWLLHNQQHAILIDPGDANICIQAIKKNQLHLDMILITHHHNDHIGGLAEIKKQFNCPVYGPDDIRIPLIDYTLNETDNVTWQSHIFHVWHTPGHTRTHLIYWNPEQAHLFCGDMLFGSGCGRNMEGQMSDLYQSLQRIAQLPVNTEIFCAHEYTLQNLRFAQMLEPDNRDIRKRIDQTESLIAHGKSTIPATLETELATNPFLRSHLSSIRNNLDNISDNPEIKIALKKFNLNTIDEYYFAVMRLWKNMYA